MLLPEHARLFREAVSSDPDLEREANRRGASFFEAVEHGLQFPDLACPDFEIAQRRIWKRLRVCSQLRMLFLGKDRERLSAIEESHNGWRAVAHAMSPSSQLTNGDVCCLVMRSILLALFSAFTADTAERRYSWFGVALHTLQDSWSPSHTVRAPITAKAFSFSPCCSIREASAGSPKAERRLFRELAAAGGPAAKKKKNKDEDESLRARGLLLEALSSSASSSTRLVDALLKEITRPDAKAGDFVLDLLRRLGLAAAQDDEEEEKEKDHPLRGRSYDDLEKGWRRLYKFAADVLFEAQQAAALREMLAAAAGRADKAKAAESTKGGEKGGRRPVIRLFMEFAAQDNALLHAAMDCASSSSDSDKAAAKGEEEQEEGDPAFWARRDTQDFVRLLFDFEKEGKRTKSSSASSGRRVARFIRRAHGMLARGPLLVAPGARRETAASSRWKDRGAWGEHSRKKHGRHLSASCLAGVAGSFFGGLLGKRAP